MGDVSPTLDAGASTVQSTRDADFDRRNADWYIDKAVQVLVFIGGISAIVFITSIFVFITKEGAGFLFERFDIRRIEPWGEKFDYNFHQAMFEVPNSGKPAGTVVEVVRPGYVMGDRLLRPAMVGVAKEGDEDPEEPGRQVDTSA